MDIFMLNAEYAAMHLIAYYFAAFELWQLVAPITRELKSKPDKVFRRLFINMRTNPLTSYPKIPDLRRMFYASCKILMRSFFNILK